MSNSAFDEMVVLARAAQENAHAPYSNFHVGACVRTESGALYAGCNVENAAYPQGQCAEASAIGNMVTSGGHRIVEVVVIGGGERLCTPCGGCRQRLTEFCDPDTPVHICGTEGLRKTLTVADLMPFAFVADNLDKS
ncbi:MAG: cytidine deaminase [Alphaproteobacteria bacterium]|jgi:cytidine deaminase|nr:cytidine deaminase [Alphaproteobacteria bacterium]